MCYQQKCFRSKILESIQVECSVLFIQVISTPFLIHKFLVLNRKCLQSRWYWPTGGDAQIQSMDFSDSWDGDNPALVETLFLFGFTSSVTMGWSIFLYYLISKIEKYGKDLRPWARPSLEVQWLRLHLAMQGTWVQTLVQEDSTCHGATKPTSHNY